MAELRLAFDELDAAPQSGSIEAPDDTVHFAPPVGDGNDAVTDTSEDITLELAPEEGLCCVCDSTFEDKVATSTGLFFLKAKQYCSTSVFFFLNGLL